MNHLRRFGTLFRKEERDRQLSDELAFHLEKQVEQNLAAGMSAEEARRAALRAFGGVEQIKEECRDTWGARFIDALLQDVRFGLRMLAKNPGFTAVAVLTLALGIGANTAIFSVVNAVLLKPLPYAEPDRLMAVGSMRFRGVPSPDTLSYPDFFDYRARNHVFEHLVTGRGTSLTLTGYGPPRQLHGNMTTWDLFPALGIAPVLGRGFLPSEEAAGARVAVLSHALWQSQFGGDPGIVGRTITLDRRAYTVVGVAPPGFAFPVNEPCQLWTTIAPDHEAVPGDRPVAEERGAHMLTALGRLKPGVSIEQARADLNVIAAALARQYPDTNTNTPQAWVRPELATLVGDSRTPLLILLGAVGLVLLIACANIANLLLARAAKREQEMAVRSALGAKRGRVVRQLLTESLLLALMGGAAGTVLAKYALGVVLPLGGDSIPRLAQASLDGRVLGFSLLLAVLTSLVFGLTPALHASKADLLSCLRDRSRSGAFLNNPVRGGLVILQVTVGLVLVSAAGLLMASLIRLERSELGFKPDHLLTFSFSLPDTHYSTAQQVAFYDQMLQRMGALPGVQSVGGVWPLPLGDDNAVITFDIEERPAGPSNRPSARMAFATPDYFRTAGIPLLRGRYFTERDDPKSPRVLIVNQAFADQFFPGEDVIGKRITPGATAAAEKETLHEIVGVVGSAKLFALDPEPKPIYYFPYKQLPWQPPQVMLRTTVPPHTLEASARKRMAELDPLVPVFDVRTMEDLLSVQVAAPRFLTLLLACFAGFALLLAMVGLYGVMAYSVAGRTSEIGVRMALGAGRTAVLAMILKQALALLAVGLGLGLALSVLAGNLLQSVLFGGSALDPAVMGLSVLLVALTGLLAAYLPARRAAAMDPMVALRHE